MSRAAPMLLPRDYCVPTPHPGAGRSFRLLQSSHSTYKDTYTLESEAACKLKEMADTGPLIVAAAAQLVELERPAFVVRCS